MRPHSHKFLDDVKDTLAIALAAPAPSFRSREYYNHTTLTPTTNNGNNNFSSLNETTTGNPLDQSSSGIDYTSSMVLKVVLLFTAFWFVRFFYVFLFCYDSNSRNDRIRRGHQTLSDRCSSSGIDPSIIQSLPLFAYDGNVKEPVDCPICLAEFEKKEMVKLIPFCRHLFHPQCIDMWLSTHASCPLCRSTQLLLPLPLPLPLPPSPHKDPPSCFVAIECVCGGPSVLRSRTDITGPTDIENGRQQQQRKALPPISILKPSSSSAVTRANSFSSSSRLEDRVYLLHKSSSF